MVTIMLARSLRYYVEGALAVFYGRRVILFMKDNGLMIVSVAGALCVVGVLVYLLVRRRRGATTETAAGGSETSAAD
ncbi:MAG TPA: MYXO-CTERM sorting domain-containing protein, partial [Pyrinomonadaceae bacterium]|nr:MYXO-CTERM sorting domain-containing protein [Pyrinomonadaceae bacterium]